MPCVAETAWGYWGSPNRVPAAFDEKAELHGETGGILKPEFSNTLKWYQKRTIYSKDKEQCATLLKQLEKQQETEGTKTPSSLHSSSDPKQTSVRFALCKQERISETPTKSKEIRRVASPSKSVTEVSNRKLAYHRQLHSVNRLSRPKTAKVDFARPTPIEILKSKTAPRPKSAMADLGRRKVNDPYLTTHTLDYPGYETGYYAEATRPRSSKGFTVPYNISDPVGPTTFEEEFPRKVVAMTQPIRTGTSSGSRNNRPHPHETFMVWKLPHETARGMTAAPAKHLGYRKLTKSRMEQILRDKMKSTYQEDFLGLPQGHQIKDQIDAPVDWRASVRRPLDTTVRQIYGKPEIQKELKGNTTRYGCNKNKGISAVGAIPSVTKDHVKNQEFMKGKTIYDTEFRDTYSRPDLLELYNEQTNKKMLDSFLRFAKIQEERGVTEATA